MNTNKKALLLVFIVASIYAFASHRPTSAFSMTGDFFKNMNNVMPMAMKRLNDLLSPKRSQ